MRKYFFRYENLLPMLTLLFFWGFDLYLVALNQRTIFSKPQYVSISLKLVSIFLILSLIPYYFYLRIRRNVIIGTRLTAFYFPFSIFLLFVSILCQRFLFALLFFPPKIYLRISGGVWTNHYILNTVSEWAVVIYLLLQIVFIIDTISTLRRYRRERQQLIEQIGKD
jgi:hypothetical protein